MSLFYAKVKINVRSVLDDLSSMAGNLIGITPKLNKTVQKSYKPTRYPQPIVIIIVREELYSGL